MSRAIRDWFRSLMDVRRGEWFPTGLMFLYGFLALTSYYVLKPARNSLFVDRVGADNLPYVYLLTALVVSVVMIGYSRFVDRVRELPLLLVTFGFLSLNLLGFWWWLRLGDSMWSSGAFYVWGKLYPLLLVSQFYLVGNLLFSTRQARRLFGLIGVGLILGGIAGSSISGWAASAVGTETLLLIAAGILGACALIVVALAPRMGRREGGGGRLVGEVSGDALKHLRESRHLRTIAWILGLTIVVGTLVDWQFNSAVERFIPGEDAKTAFFGKFFFGLNISSILIQVFFTSFVLRKFGVGLAMLALPAGLVVASLGMLAVPVLLTAALAKGTEGALRYSLDQSTRELLFLPVPSEIKYKVKPLIDLAIYRGGTGVGGLILILLVNVLALPWDVTVRLVAGVALLCTAGWIGFTLRMRKEFRTSIRRLIGARDVELDELIYSRLDADAVNELKRALARGDRSEILYALALLEGIGDPGCADEVARLLEHESGDVRARAIGILGEMGDGRHVERVTELLRDDALDVRVEAIRYLCAFHERDAHEAMRGFLQDADPEVRIAAAACAFRHGDRAHVPAAVDAVARLSRSGEADARRRAAELLGALDSPSEEGLEILRRLAEDPEPAVRGEALRAAGAAGASSLIPLLLERLGRHGEWRAARQGLVGMGERAHGPLLDALRDETCPKLVRLRAPSVLSRVGSQEVADALFTWLGKVRERDLRFETLKALNRLRRDRSDLSFENYEIEPVVEREVEEAYRWTARATAIGRERGGAEGDHDPRSDTGVADDGAGAGVPAALSLLERTLRQRSREAVERASRALGLRFPLGDLYAAVTALEDDDPLTRERGYELLENTLPLRYRRLFDPLLDPERGPGDVTKAARSRYGEEPLEGLHALKEAAEGDPWVDVLRRAAGGEASLPQGRFGPGRPAPWSHLTGDAAGPGDQDTAGEDEDGRGGTFMEIVERAALLGRMEIFGDLRTEDLAGIAALMRERTYASGETLFEEGQGGTELFVVASGRVEARRESRTLFTAEPGETVGDLSLLDGRTRNYDAVAVEETHALILHREDFYQLAEERFGIVRGVLTHLARVIRALNRRAGGDVPGDRATVTPRGEAPRVPADGVARDRRS